LAVFEDPGLGRSRRRSGDAPDEQFGPVRMPAHVVDRHRVDREHRLLLPVLARHHHAATGQHGELVALGRPGGRGVRRISVKPVEHPPAGHVDDRHLAAVPGAQRRHPVPHSRDLAAVRMSRDRARKHRI
jgi:hypothetical protein